MMRILRMNPIAALAVVALCMLGASVSIATDVGYTERQVALNNGSYVVPGILALPARPRGKLPVILLLHGTASQKNEVGGLYQRLAAKLARQGYASLRIDFAGTGDSKVDYREYTLTSARRDAVIALDYLATQSQFDAQRLGLIGSSQGGLIAQLVASGDARIKALVTWSTTAGNGIGSYRSLLFDQYYDEARRNGVAVVRFPWRVEPLNFSWQWFDEIEHNTALDAMSRYHGKLLAIAGSADDVVPYESSIRLLQAAGSAQASFYLLKGANHIFNVLAEESQALATDQSTPERLLTLTADWLSKNL